MLNYSSLGKTKSQTVKFLKDGKRDWRRYKLQSLAVAKAFGFFEELTKYANKIYSCGSYLKFSCCPQGHDKRLIQAYFCRSRLCVTCQWRKSLAVFAQLITLIHNHKGKYKSDIPLLLTLTVPNVRADNLRHSIDNMQQAFKKVMMRRGVKRAVRSWFRGLEITYNDKQDSYHPHFHVLLIVPGAYFKRERGLYIGRDTWLAMWREATGILEITQVDVRRVRKQSKRKPIEAITAEVAKYATKPASYVKRTLKGDFEASGEVVRTLHYALRNRRLVAYGGLFAKMRKELRLEDVEKADLVHITDEQQGCQCSICKSDLVDEIYKWNLGVGNYLNG